MIVALPGAVRLRFVLLFCLLQLAAVQIAQGQFEFPEGFGGLPGGPSNRGGEVTVSAQFTPAQGQQPALLFVTAQIAEGYYVYAVDQGNLPDGGGGPQATQIELTVGGGAQIVGPWRPIEPPRIHVDQQAWIGLELREHEGKITWYAPIELADGVDPASLSLAGQVIGQACNPQTCIPFEQTFAAQLGGGFSVPPQAFSEEAPLSASDETSLWLVLCSGLLGGLILNLMPCVLPVIGLKLMSFAKQGGESRARIWTLNLSYSAGLFVVFMILGTLAALAQLGLSDESFAWGELYTLTWFKVSMTALVFAMALSFLGTWELPIPGFATSGKATKLAAREGPFGAFCMGIVTTLLAIPCSGPFLGPVFGFTISQPVYVIYLIFASVGVGMALPYLLIGAVPSLISWLPKPGAWMDTLKNLLGFVLLATVVYLFSTIKHDYFLATLSLLFGIWLACWWIGRTPVTAPKDQRRNVWIGATAVATLVGWLAFSFLTPRESLLPWQPYSPAALAQARAEGKTVMVDFSANWCLTCKMNLKLAINRQGVKELVEENQVVTLLADWTDRNPQIKAALRQLNSQSIPLLAIYPADPQREVIVLPDVLTQMEVLQALQEAGPSKPAGPDQSLAKNRGAAKLGSDNRPAGAFR